MIGIITLLLSFQLIGEVVVVALGLALPGPVMGMALLFLGLCLWGAADRVLPHSLDETVGVLLGNLSLLFVPAGVGVVLHLSLVREEWLPIVAALLGSTILTVGLSALAMSWLLQLSGNGTESGEGSGDAESGGGA
ncbi:CidA/LrgA family protein [Fodinicurvata sp. EGI_FJ10296]|uniref:CidA/LrgA family protein n=1 Tax=Fodinicurvata sp. EGI_FJ10296 TaxID=3231908 RepID=UPI003452D31F